MSGTQQILIKRQLLWRRQWDPTPTLLPGKSHGWRSLVACSPWGSEESDTTERLHFHFSLSCIGEGNGNPLPCSYLENPRDGAASWAAIYGVTQSRTRLKQLSSIVNVNINMGMLLKERNRKQKFQINVLADGSPILGAGASDSLKMWEVLLTGQKKRGSCSELGSAFRAINSFSEWKIPMWLLTMVECE